MWDQFSKLLLWDSFLLKVGWPTLVTRALSLAFSEMLRCRPPTHLRPKAEHTSSEAADNSRSAIPQNISLVQFQKKKKINPVLHATLKWPIFYIAKIQCYVSCWKVDSSDSMEMSKSFWPLVIIPVMPLVACRLSCIFCTCAWRFVSASWTSVSCWVSGMPLVCLSPVKIIS